MRQPSCPDHHQRLLPPGHRWGFGAHSVLPYLQLALQGRAAEGTILNPVFPHMEQTLRALRRQH